VVIDGCVDVVVADRHLLVPVVDGGCAAKSAPAAAVGDAAELLHIDVDQ